MKRMYFIQLCALLVLLVACEARNKNADLFGDVCKQNEKMITILDDEINGIRHQARDDLADLAKIEYRPILPALESIRSHFRNIYKQAEWLEKEEDFNTAFPYFMDTTDILLSEISEVYETLLLEHGETFGLRAEHTDQLILEVKDTLKDHQKDLANINWKDQNKEILAVTLSNLKLKIKLAEYQMIKEVGIFYGGKLGCNLMIYFPIVSPRKCAVKVNEIFEAELSIGTYSSQIDPTYLSFVVNGDTLKADDSDKATVAIVSSKSGKKQLNVSYSIINRLTGEVSSESSTFEYEVLPK